MAIKTLNISLPDALDAYVHSKVESGGYASVSEVIRESLRTMQEVEAARLRGLRLAIQEGLQSPLARPLSEITTSEIAARGAKRAKGRKI